MRTLVDICEECEYHCNEVRLEFGSPRDFVVGFLSEWSAVSLVGFWYRVQL